MSEENIGATFFVPLVRRKTSQCQFPHEHCEEISKELETTKKILDDLQVFIHRFQEEFYLKNSASGLSKLYADIVEYDLAKLSKEGQREE